MITHRASMPAAACAAVLAAAALAMSAAGSPVSFTDVTGSAGITFVHNSGASGKKYLPETMGSGAVWFDADGDGWQDLLFVNAKSWPGRSAPARSLPALYRNTQNGAFADVTRGSGLDVEVYGIGAAAADFDNDG